MIASLNASRARSHEAHGRKGPAAAVEQVGGFPADGAGAPRTMVAATGGTGWRG